MIVLRAKLQLRSHLALMDGSIDPFLRSKTSPSVRNSSSSKGHRIIESHVDRDGPQAGYGVHKRVVHVKDLLSLTISHQLRTFGP